MASFNSGAMSPEFPIQVMHPYPAVMNPSSLRSLVTPDLLKYSVTTLDPGEREVLMYGLTLRPLLTAFLARRPAAIRESGLEVLVQLVMAARTTSPWVRV